MNTDYANAPTTAGMPNEAAEFSYSPYSPFYKESGILYTNMFTNFLEPYEYTGWRDEQLSWVKTCYIHGNLNPSPTYEFSGPDAAKFLSKYCVNSFEKFPIGSGKHCFTCGENGAILGDGIILRTAENAYVVYWVGILAMFAAQESQNYNMTCKDMSNELFLLQVGGPRSLETLEKTLETDLHDLKFNRFKNITYKGQNLRIYRMGMAGSLAYEVHGAISFSQEVYNDIYEAGKEYGIRRLGFHTYLMQHGINGFPQFGQHYSVPGWCFKAGSMRDEPDEKFAHTPFDVDQGFVVKFDHDFVGRAALERIKEDQPTKMVCLEWNEDDLADIYRSQFTDDPYMQMEDPNHFNSMGIKTWHDKVLLNGKQVGISTGRTHSIYYHKMISLCYMDKEYAQEGLEVKVLWGEPDTKQKEIRAIVARFPYFNENRNNEFDVNNIPRRY